MIIFYSIFGLVKGYNYVPQFGGKTPRRIQDDDEEEEEEDGDCSILCLFGNTISSLKQYRGTIDLLVVVVVVAVVVVLVSLLSSS